MNPADILQIARHLQQSGMQAMELRDAGTRLRIVARSGERVAAADAAPPASAEVVASDIVVRSHGLGMVRLCYPSRSGAGLVAGARLQAGEPAIFLESRGIIKTIEAPVSGEVVQLFVAQGSKADYGMPLFTMRAMP